MRIKRELNNNIFDMVKYIFVNEYNKYIFN